MGTRSLTVVYDDQPSPIITMYRQKDGYPSGHGLELANFLSQIKLTNGFGSEAKMGQVANGMGCLAAQMIAHFKTGVGEIYIVTPDDHGQEYEYFVTETAVTVRDSKKAAIFSGSWAEFKDFCQLVGND
ncbi:hypothetical protein [Methylobacter tundripaludum]